MCVAGGGLEKRPAAHRAHVVVAALDLVPRTSQAAVVALADVCHDFDRLVDHPFEKEQTRRFVLDSRPHLVGIHQRRVGASAPGPRAVEHSRLVVADVCARKLPVAREILAAIVFHDGSEGASHAARRQDVAETQRVRPPLPEKLVRVATDSVGLHRLRFRVVPVDVVLAAPQQLVGGLASLAESVAVFFHRFGVPDGLRHFLTGPERGKVERLDEAIGPLDLHIVGAWLGPVDYPVAPVVSVDDVVERAAYMVPNRFQPPGVAAGAKLPVTFEDGAEQPVEGGIGRPADPPVPRPPQVQRDNHPVGQVSAFMLLAEPFRLPHRAFELREKARDSHRIVPHVRAVKRAASSPGALEFGARAAASLESVEAPLGVAKACRRAQDRYL